MRISRLSALAIVAALALAPAANALPQDLRPPDARDAGAAWHAHMLQDLAHLRAQNPNTSSLAGTTDPKVVAAKAQEKYYTSYRTPVPVRHVTANDDSSPWLSLGLGLGLIVLVAGAVAIAVRTRRHAARVRVA